jgi:hypothetical protein
LGECVLILPALLYSAEFLVSRSHTLSVEWLAACSAAELVAAAVVLRRVRAQGSSQIERRCEGRSEVAGL